MMKGIEFGSDLKVRLPARFNVAVPFVDRHLAEGRGAKVAIRTAGETVTYAQLAERVNRAGNALLAAGLKPGDRLLMVVKDCPAFFYLFWGAIKAGIVPAPLNTMLRAADYAYLFEDSGCGLVVYSSEFAQEVEPALKQVSVKAPHGRRLPRAIWPRPPTSSRRGSPSRPTTASGSIPRARPAGPRGRCTCSATWW